MRDVCKVASLGLLAVLTAACIVHDPLYCDESHACNKDPALNFCDLRGAYPASEGHGNTCIASPFDAGIPDSTPDAVPPDAGCTDGATRNCGTDEGACELGIETCRMDGTWGACTGGTVPTTEMCNMADDDCDGTIDNGTNACGGSCTLAELPSSACDGADGDLCNEGIWICASINSVACSDSTDTLAEDCNTLDDDCDLSVDEGCSCVNGMMQPCGTDVGACTAGMQACTGGVWGTCNGIDPTAEVCNATDDDCDGMIDEGFGLGAPCDGADTDLCPEGTTLCDGMGGTLCTDTSGDIVELCNGDDDDCDGMTDEGFGLGSPCDGPDADFCTEGVIACNVADGASCTDTSGDSIETCNGLDDDCDGTTDDGFDLLTDVNNCGECAFTCTNANGTTVCDGALCVPTCSFGAQDCDLTPSSGCELRDTNPPCPTVMSAAIVGDGASAGLAFSGFSEEWYRVNIQESSGSTTALTARIDLSSPVGVNYDLFVYCQACGAGVAHSSTNGAAMVDTVNIGRDDQVGDTSYDILIEVRYSGANMCGNWGLTVTGNVATGDRTCN